MYRLDVDMISHSIIKHKSRKSTTRFTLMQSWGSCRLASRSLLFTSRNERVSNHETRSHSQLTFFDEEIRRETREEWLIDWFIMWESERSTAELRFARWNTFLSWAALEHCCSSERRELLWCRGLISTNLWIDTSNLVGNETLFCRVRQSEIALCCYISVRDMISVGSCIFCLHRRYSGYSPRLSLVSRTSPRNNLLDHALSDSLHQNSN